MSEYLDTNDHEPVDAFDIDREVRRLRIAAEARRIFAAENRGPEDPFDAGTLAEILARPAQPPMRIEELAPSDASILLVAQRKTGKTTMSGNYGRALLTGEPFLGRFDVRPLDGDVAVLNYEVSGAQLARWFDDVGVPRDRCHLVNLRGRRNPLHHEDDRARLAAMLRARGVESVIVDPFGRAFNGAEQNNAGEVSRWLTDLDLFVRSEVGARDLLLTAHAGWNGERTRGSSALEDWPDAIWTMTRDPEGDDGNRRRYFRAEGRDVDLDEGELTFDPDTRHLTYLEGGRRQAAVQRQRDEGRRQILDLLTEHTEGLSGKELSELAGRKDAAFTAARTALVEAGDVLQETRSGRGGGKLYRLNPSKVPNLPKPAEPVPSEPTEPPSIEGRFRFGTLEDEPTEKCQTCSEPIDPALTADGLHTHPGCEAGR
ncbi:AAA domain-containing protein [Tessaracoccus bendigoensis DSM 12906]|uniref:AAA domain-containing protein n=1 Tax=Tessaracoccus bendigoensis DSM 12906 TaxID=1123357 RepID=A0A1M6HW59_9ACTN|nr:AAA family ATPase [Tessaracoccus bendigoensis]SHJ26378.1 AAA domain-containing protein [Tessaracoccus bendigoensis DSM 12906]